jgi:hypothetical protein
MAGKDGKSARRIEYDDYVRSSTGSAESLRIRLSVWKELCNGEVPGGINSIPLKPSKLLPEKTKVEQKEKKNDIEKAFDLVSEERERRQKENAEFKAKHPAPTEKIKVAQPTKKTKKVMTVYAQA